MRIISFAHDFRDHVSPIYTNYNLLKIKDLIDLKNVILVHDYLNKKLPDSFDGYFSIHDNHEYDPEINQACSRIIRAPACYNQYELTDMRPQVHTDHYRFRNISVKGQLTVPNFNTKKYGRNSVKGNSIMTWNFFKKIFPDKDFTSLSRGNLKKIISDYFINKYRNNVLD